MRVLAGTLTANSRPSCVVWSRAWFKNALVPTTATGDCAAIVLAVDSACEYMDALSTSTLLQPPQIQRRTSSKQQCMTEPLYNRATPGTTPQD